MADVVDQLKSRCAMLKEIVDKQTKLEGARDQILSQVKELGLDTIEDARNEEQELAKQLEGITNESMETIQAMDAIIKES